MLGDVNTLFVFRNLLTMTRNVLPLQFKKTIPPIIWIFAEGDGIESMLPFKIFSTLCIEFVWFGDLQIGAKNRRQINKNRTKCTQRSCLVVFWCWFCKLPTIMPFIFTKYCTKYIPGSRKSEWFCKSDVGSNCPEWCHQLRRKTFQCAQGRQKWWQIRYCQQPITSSSHVFTNPESTKPE